MAKAKDTGGNFVISARFLQNWKFLIHFLDYIQKIGVKCGNIRGFYAYSLTKTANPRKKLVAYFNIGGHIKWEESAFS